MNVSEILDAIGGEIVARNCFLVDISVSKDNDIVLTIESENGKIELEDCVSLSRFFESKFDREVEDYSLTVSSAGLDQPFKVLKQYLKAVSEGRWNQGRSTDQRRQEDGCHPHSRRRGEHHFEVLSERGCGRQEEERDSGARGPFHYGPGKRGTSFYRI